MPRPRRHALVRTAKNGQLTCLACKHKWFARRYTRKGDPVICKRCSKCQLPLRDISTADAR